MCVESLVSCQTSQLSMVPKASLPASALRARAGNVVEDPCHLASGKIRVDDEAGAFADEVFVPVLLQSIAVVGRAPVLPHDRVVDRSAGLAIPDDRRLALVGDADGRDISWTQVGASERLGGDGDLCGPDLIGIVLDPARTRKDLREFPLAGGHDIRVLIEDDGARARGALIEREDVRHDSASLIRDSGFGIRDSGFGVRRTVLNQRGGILLEDARS